MLQENHFTQINPLVVGLFVGVAGAGLALLLVMAGPIITFGFFFGLLLGLYLLTSLDAALAVLLATAGLLPYATLPFRIAFTPTLIECALAGFLTVYAFQWMTGRRRDFHLTPVSWLLLAFIFVNLFAFLLGLRGDLIPQMSQLQEFVMLIASIGMALILADVANQTESLRRITLTLLMVGFVGSSIGVVLWVLPDDTAEAILNRLGRVGYPVGGVIRYREDGVSIGNERAIGTWIDPNAYGGFLLMMGGLAGSQLFARKPILPRWAAFPVFGSIALALFLSDSRGSFLGFAFGGFVIAVLRYRKLLWLGMAGGVAMLFLPQTQAFVSRFIAGITASDLETQMRLGEYQDALTLIGRYPVFGVGFTGVPDIDIYIGYSSTYLTMAAFTGVLGLLTYLLTMGGILGWGLRWWHDIRQDDMIQDVWLGLLAGILGAMLGGLFDHFYFNPAFQATSMLFWSFVGMFIAATRIVWERSRAMKN